MSTESGKTTVPKPFSYHSTVLFVKDVKISEKFYTEIMGEEIELDLGRNIGFKSRLAIWEKSYANNVIFGDPKSGNEKSGSKRMLELYYETDDMNRTSELLKKSDVVLVHDVKEQPWCQLTVRFLDPDCHMIEIGERMDVCVKRLAKSGKTAEQITKSTTLPPDVVNYMLNI